MSESDMLKQCLRGDAQAWDELFERHYAATGRFVFQLSPDLTAEDVEEICQETFMSVIRNLALFKGASQFQTWVFRIAANKCRDFHQRATAGKRGGGVVTFSLDEEDPETGLAHDAPSSLPGPDEDLLREEGAGMVAKALDQLGEPCREIIQLRYFADLSYEEISRALNLNLKTVSSRLSKCLDRLETVARLLFSQSINPRSPSNH
jgi:RNA polymerase sigma-70 factor (ECF subfamily)